RRSRVSSSRSALVTPSVRLPASRSACAIQLRIVCSVGSNCAAISGIGRPARTSSTILLRNSAGYGGLDFCIVNTSRSKDRVSTKPGQLQSIHDLTGLGVDPVHLEHALCNVQSICRSIHFGPSVPQVVVSRLHFGTSMPFGPGGPLLQHAALHPR